jgi:CBS domain-containing protein
MKTVQARELHVRDLMSGNVVTAYHHSNVSNAINLMGEKNIGSVVVVDSSGPVGVLSERDIISKVVGRNKEVESTIIMEVLSPLYFTLAADATLHEAARLMTQKKSRLLVFEGGELIGVVTATDIVRGIHRLGETFSIRGAMTRKVVTVLPETPVDLVVRDMDEKRIGSVIVVTNQNEYRIFTERDLIRRMLVPRRSLRTMVGEVSSAPLLTAELGLDGRGAAEIMAANRIKRLPIFDKRRMVGIVTARDVVEAFARS